MPDVLLVAGQGITIFVGRDFYEVADGSYFWPQVFEVRPVGLFRVNAVRRILSQPSAFSVTNWYASRNNCAIVMNSKHLTGCRSVSYVYTLTATYAFSPREWMRRSEAKNSTRHFQTTCSFSEQPSVLSSPSLRVSSDALQTHH